MNIDPGEMTDRIMFEVESSTDDGYGGKVKNWVADGSEMWARVRPMSGGERAQANQVEASAMYAVIIRNRPVSPASRIKWVNNGNQILNIRFPGQDTRAQYIKIEAELGVQT
jgi:SPP1 family predicted phage head-tail adaptor